MKRITARQPGAGDIGLKKAGINECLCLCMCVSGSGWLFHCRMCLALSMCEYGCVSFCVCMGMSLSESLYEYVFK